MLSIRPVVNAHFSEKDGWGSYRWKKTSKKKKSRLKEKVSKTLNQAQKFHFVKFLSKGLIFD